MILDRGTTNIKVETMMYLRDSKGTVQGPCGGEEGVGGHIMAAFGNQSLLLGLIPSV